VTFSQVDHEVNALIKHADGIDNASVFWSVDTAAGYNSVSMSLTDPVNDIWTGQIPYQQAGETVFYHIHAEANNGKQQVRPITAPQGFWKFRVLQNITGIVDADVQISVYPNPSSAIFRVNTGIAKNVSYSVLNMKGELIRSGQSQNGMIDLDLSDKASGLYALQLNWNGGIRTMRLNRIE
jgi:hypothetical protein